MWETQLGRSPPASLFHKSFLLSKWFFSVLPNWLPTSTDTYGGTRCCFILVQVVPGCRRSHTLKGTCPVLRGLESGDTNRQQMSPDGRNEPSKLTVLLVRSSSKPGLLEKQRVGCFIPGEFCGLFWQSTMEKSMDCGCLCNSWLCG